MKALNLKPETTYHISHFDQRKNKEKSFMNYSNDTAGWEATLFSTQIIPKETNKFYFNFFLIYYLFIFKFNCSTIIFIRMIRNSSFMECAVKHSAGMCSLWE